MRKGLVKRCLAFCLVTAMTAGLCGCGGGEQEADPALAKEHVYRLQEIELPQLYEPGSGDMSIVATAHKNGTVYMVAYVNDWSGENYKENDYRVISMNEDGSNVKVTPLEIPETEAADQNGGQMQVMPEMARPAAPAEEVQTEEQTETSEEGEETPEEDGETPEESEETPGEDGETPEGGAEASENGAETEDNTMTQEPGADGDAAVDDEYVEPTVWENINYNSFSMMADGSIFAMKNHYIEDNSDPENYVSHNTVSLCCWDPEGKLLWENSVGELDDYTWVNRMLEGADGSVYLILTVNSEDYSTTDYYRVRVGADGSVGEREKLSEETSSTVFNYIDQMVSQGNGTYFVIFRDENDWQKEYYTTYNVDTDTMGETKDFPSAVTSSYDYNVMRPGISHDLIYTGNGGIYSWNQGQEAGELMMDYINSDLYIQNFMSVIELSETSFLGVYFEDWESGAKAGIFTYVKPEDIQDKKVLVMAGLYVDNDLKKRVIEYNRNNSDYRIVIKEYNIYNDYTTEGGYDGGVTKLNNDIISGGMPDILVNSYGDPLPVNSYLSKGLIANIDKLIEEDEELSQVEFMQNAFDAYRKDGKLYYIVPDFEVYTVIGKKALIGDRESWTMADMQQVLSDLGGETKAFSGDITRNNFIDMVMRYCGKEFVDVSTGKCAFNTEDFISMMEYAKALPSDTQGEDYDEDYWDEYWESYESQYRQNKTLLMEANFWRFDNIAYTINGRIGDEVAYVGFPTESGNGSYIMSSRTYMLSAKSKNLDEAWNFMRYYLTDEYQDQVNYFPVQKDKFNEQSKKAMERRTWEWTDEETGEVHTEYEDMSIWINGEAVPYEPLSQEQLDQFVAFVESVHNPYYYNEEVMNIINEEIEGFFSGQKQAKEVADIIQSRVQNYVDENN